MATLYTWDGAQWQAGVYFDFWDSAWADVRELWVWAGGAWQLVYRRARAIAVSKVKVPELDVWNVEWTTDGVGIGPIGYDVLVDTVPQVSGTTVAGATETVQVNGGAGAFVQIRLRNVRNREIATF